MSPTLEALLRSWPSDPWLLAALAAAGLVYLRGWFVLRRRDHARWHGGRLTAMGAALAAIYVALASPIEPFAALLLYVHMLQHLLLTMVAPPLVWLAAPCFPLLRGLPREVRAVWIAPLVRRRGLRRLFARLTHPLLAWPLFTAATWAWHLPAAYELALARPGWHFVEHACFLAAGLVFWYPVVRPYPSRPRWSEWLLFPYLILADVQATVLAAWLTFSRDVLYPHYDAVPRVAGISALDDQAVAGVLMWVPGSIALLVPLAVIGVSVMSGARERIHRPARKGAAAARVAGAWPSLPVIQSGPPCRSSTAAAFDLLDVSFLGRLLRWRRAWLLVRWVMLLLAVSVIFDGLRGPPATPMNLAGVLPWIHWRGALVLVLLVGGNFFCAACPFTLPRWLARRWLPRGRDWPRWLANKWLAVALVALFLWSYEAFSLWNSPWLTAWIALGYFIAAALVDGVFRGAAFCKYVCPIGQFNFVQSLVSPLEVKVRAPAVCASCTTKECIHGTPSVPGCQLQLFQPRKSGNLDCTFCLDCVHACPHQNVGLIAARPGHDLWSQRLRSGIGRYSSRADLAALVLVLVFGALANAAGMVAPVVNWLDDARRWLGNPSRLVVTSLFYGVAIVLLPLAAAGIAATISRAWGRIDRSWLAIAARFSFALVPLGFGMWLAHYSFHCLTSVTSIVPVTQRLAADLGGPALGEPSWHWACCRPPSAWLTHLQIVMLDFGLLLSLYTGYRIAEDHSRRVSQALRVFAPWALLMVSLFALGVWIVYQPMEMRGTLSLAP
jgi:cytochrome c oxidase assembly factor CtaG